MKDGFLDIRPGEWRIASLAFATFLLILTGHTVLETARDALLLTKLAPRAIGIVYLAVALCALPAASVAGRASERFGPRRSLVGTLVIASAIVMVLFALPTTREGVLALYVLSGLVGSIAVPQFWSLLASAFTVAQGRRLIGPVAAAGVMGGVLGSAGAALAIPAVPIKALLPVSATVFLCAAAILVFVPHPKRASPPPVPRFRGSLQLLREEPFLIRVAVVVALSTATLLAIDYFFKWTVIRTVPKADVATFVARYYALLNSASLIVQLFLANAIVRRLGVAASMLVTPSLLLFGAAASFAVGGAAPLVLLLKAADDMLRNSVHRTTIEVLYLPVRSDLRQRAKPFIDGALGRAAQATTAGALLTLGSMSFLSPRMFAAIVVGLASAWFAIAMWTRDSYLGLLRRAVGPARVSDAPDALDLAGAEVLVEYLASDEPTEVIAAMSTLERRGRERLIPALVLHHDDERVLLRALEIFGPSSRQDWISLARRLLADRREPVRVAAAHALARRGRLELERIADDAGPRVRAYATLHQVFRDSSGNVLDDPRTAALLREPGPDGDPARLGLLAGIEDSPPSQRLTGLLLALADEKVIGRSAEATRLLARAAAHQREVRLIPSLVDRLAARAGREDVRAALVLFGDAAFEQISLALGDPSRGRRLRAQLPHALARFGTKRAGDLLLDHIEAERDGVVRYKSIRALGRLVADYPVRVEQVRVERLSEANLIEHLRILGMRVALGQLELPPEWHPRSNATARLLAGLMDDKLRQSLERAFRLLKIAYPTEDIHRVHVACMSQDALARANAGEFLDTLLMRRTQQRLRELFRLVCDDLSPAARVARASRFLPRPPPSGPQEALLALIDDSDLAISALAALYAIAIGGQPLVSAVEHARLLRPEIDVTATRLFEDSVAIEGAARG